MSQCNIIKRKKGGNNLSKPGESVQLVQYRIFTVLTLKRILVLFQRGVIVDVFYANTFHKTGLSIQSPTTDNIQLFIEIDNIFSETRVDVNFKSCGSVRAAGTGGTNVLLAGNKQTLT